MQELIFNRLISGFRGKGLHKRRVFFENCQEIRIGLGTVMEREHN